MCNYDETKEIPVYIDILIAIFVAGVISLTVFAIADRNLKTKQISACSEAYDIAKENNKPKKPWEG